MPIPMELNCSLCLRHSLLFDPDNLEEKTMDTSVLSVTLSEGSSWMKDYLEEAREHFETRFSQNTVIEDNIRNYTLIRTLGSGSFGKVMLVVHNIDEMKPIYAVKILNKERIVKTKQIAHTLNEKRVLQSVSSPFIVKLVSAFKDTTNLYMVMEFANGGELFTLIRKKGRLSEEWSQFYSYQMLMALQYLHFCNILYRDLKPENILIDQMGYCKLADLGFTKKAHVSWTLCGTPQYLAPEMILNKGYGKSVDYWGLGILIFEMIAGYVPFDHKTPIKLYEMIVECKLVFPGMFKGPVVDLLSKLIEPDVTKRYGNLKGGAWDIINHPWYSKVDYRKMLTRSYKAPWVPSQASLTDGSNFERQKEETMRISRVDKYPQEFADF